jgi:chloramphenicol 3-O-phosphotransferase
MASDRGAEQGLQFQFCGKIVILNGFPAAGKFTIATKIKDYFPKNTVRLIDNHILINPAQAIYPDRSGAHHELRRKFREIAFEAIRKIAEEGKTVLMTACLADNDADINTFKEHISMVRNTPIPIYWINLKCDGGVLEKRVASKERREGTRSKLTDASILRQMMRDHELLSPHPHDYDVRLIAETMDVSGALEESVHQLLHILHCQY